MRPRSIALIVAKEVLIPPRSLARVLGRSPANKTGILTLSPLISSGGDGEFLSPRCVVRLENRETEIQVTNVGQSPVLLKRDQELNLIDEEPIRSISTLPEHAVPQPIPIVDQHHFQTALDDSLDKAQKEKLLTLLAKHKRHFRQKSDSGPVPCEKSLYHTIDTGVNRPISVAPRRLALRKTRQFGHMFRT